MSYLHCPECRLTVSVSAYYYRDQCPRCRTPMEPRDSLRPSAPPLVPPAAAAPTPLRPR